jgi:phosphate acetyltransferase
MTVLEKLILLARSRLSHIVLSEGSDERVARAAVRAASEGIARISVVAGREEFAAITNGLPGRDLIEVHDPVTSPKRGDYASAYHMLRRHKGVTPEDANKAVADNLVFAAMMVREGDADGTIGGAVATTADTLRAALQIIGKAPNTSIVSSFFLMSLPPPFDQLIIFADCALVIEPNAQELASIARASAQSYKNFVEQDPKVAMLSFSTKGSAAHESLDRIRDAIGMVNSSDPDLEIDGELQFDSAFIPEIGRTKAPDSAVAGAANVFIFPNLDSGNIGYKIAQRIGGAAAIGPIIQGLSKPANDLSRGCSEEDIYQMIAVTAVQASAQKN